MKQFNAVAKKLKYRKVGSAGPRHYFEELFLQLHLLNADPSDPILFS